MLLYVADVRLVSACFLLIIPRNSHDFSLVLFGIRGDEGPLNEMNRAIDIKSHV